MNDKNNCEERCREVLERVIYDDNYSLDGSAITAIITALSDAGVLRSTPSPDVLAEARERLEREFPGTKSPYNLYPDSLDRIITALTPLLTGGKPWPTREQFPLDFDKKFPPNRPPPSPFLAVMWAYDHLFECAAPKAEFPVSEEEFEGWLATEWPDGGRDGLRKGSLALRMVGRYVYDMIRGRWDEE